MLFFFSQVFFFFQVFVMHSFPYSSMTANNTHIRGLSWASVSAMGHSKSVLSFLYASFLFPLVAYTGVHV